MHCLVLLKKRHICYQDIVFYLEFSQKLLGVSIKNGQAILEGLDHPIAIFERQVMHVDGSLEK